jgi:5-formyltetrahydrofolate cyclo-ligase
LRSIDPKDIEEKSIKISQRLCHFIKDLHNSNYSSKDVLQVGAYCPIAREVRWQLGWEYDKAEFSFPRTFEDYSMKFYQASLDELKEQNWGVSLENSSIESQPDALIIPGLLFNKKGQRLGRGAGFYDRFLETYKGPKICVAFEEQIVESIICDEHDCEWDYLVTNKDIYQRG